MLRLTLIVVVFVVLATASHGSKWHKLQSVNHLALTTVNQHRLKSVPLATQSGTRRLTNTPEQSLNLNPMISDDGAIVAFESTADLAALGGHGSFRTFRKTLMTEGGSFEQLAVTRAVSPGLSADGSKMTFASSEDLVGENPDRNSEIYLFDESQLQQITHTRPTNESSRLVEGNFEPSMSGDGRWIVFTSKLGISVSEILLFDTATGSSTRITSESRRVKQPKISADGSSIYFVRTNSDEVRSDLMIYDRLSGNTHVVSESATSLSMTTGRAVSSDGTRVVFSASNGTNQTQVFLFDWHANVSRQLTHLGTRSSDVELNPTISGDGKRVAFSTRRKVTNSSDGSVELYVMDLPTGEILQVTDAPASATGEVVSSLNFDGSLIVFNFPRLLSASVSDSSFANNSEIYFSSLAARPQFGKATVANAAIDTQPNAETLRLAPDSIAVIKGNLLAHGTEQAKLVDGKLTFAIGGTRVQVNSQPARLIFVSPDEVVFVVPANLQDGPAEFIVTNPDGFPSKAQATIARTAPGLFSHNNLGIALDSNSFLAAPFDPSNGGLRITLFATGVRNATQLAITLGGERIPVETVAPSSFPGLDEIHVQVPEQLRGGGNMSVTVSSNEIDSNSVSLDIAGNQLRDIMINEVLADPPDGLDGDANHDGTRDSSADEFVELVNATTRDLDLSGYQLLTRTLTGTNTTVRHRFPVGTVLHAGAAFVIFGGGTINNADPIFGKAQVVKASTSGLSLNNSGGVVTLRDASGQVVTSVNYGTSVGLASDANQSLTRSPDISGSLVLHRLASGSEMRPFSAGTRVDSLSFKPSPTVFRVEVFPTLAQLLRGTEIKLTAKAFDENGNQLSDIIFGWTSNNQSVATVDVAGLVKAIDSGRAEITASGRGVHSTPTMIDVPSPTPTPTPIPTPTPTPTPVPTQTPTPTPASSPSPTPTTSPSPIPSPSPTVTPVPTPTPALPNLVISEFRTRGLNGASDEFVEIYNNSETIVNLGGMKIRGSSNGGTITTRLTINANTLIPGRGHFLATNSSSYSGTVAGDQIFTSGLSNDGGIALTLPDDTVIDQVGLSPGSAFKEGMHLAPLPSDANQSYERRPGGLNGSTQDTNDNFSDFQLLTPSDPQNTQSNPTPGPIPSPSPSPSVTPTPSPSPSPTPTSTPSPNPSPTPSPSPSPSPTSNTGVVISQIYGGGGNSGAAFRNDFIEILNAGNSPVDISGWSVQYASATASTWSVTSLTSRILSPGQYYLIQESGGANGATLPTPDVTGTINLAATAGKVALVKNTTALSGTCPSGANIADLVGYGTTASCFEGAAPSVAPNNSTAIIRNSGGCSDTANNASDFTWTQPNPRNSSSPFQSCSAARLPVRTLSTTGKVSYGPALFHGLCKLQDCSVRDALSLLQIRSFDFQNKRHNIFRLGRVVYPRWLK